MTPEQCRMARAHLKWSTRDLASRAGINATTVNRFENNKETYRSTADKIEEIFNNFGVEFPSDNEVTVNRHPKDFEFPPEI